MPLLNLKGVFSRSRFDFTTDTCSVGSSTTAGNLGNSAARVSLFNNSTSGKTLALYALLGINSNTPNTLFAGLFQRVPDTSTGATQTILGGAPVQDGQVRFSIVGGGVADVAQFAFAGSGDNWIHLGGAPLALLPPKWAFAVWSPALQAQIWVSFIWGIY